MQNPITFGLPRMYKEEGEKRDFLPQFAAWLQSRGAQVVIEHGYGAKMGFSEDDYLQAAPGITFASHEETYRQNYVLILRYPSDDEVRLMHAGACLISMLHYPTRPERVQFLRSMNLEGISLDSLKDDTGRRLVENLRDVAWNGTQAAFQTLRTIYPSPGFEDPGRAAIRVTVLGAGAVGSQVVRAAISYGDENLRTRLASKGLPGVKVTVIDYDFTRMVDEMRTVLEMTDILVDATQRPDSSKPVIPNDWIAHLPAHAVLLDLSVDPYNCKQEPFSVKGIEGIPQGNLDRYVFAPDDPAYAEIPDVIPTCHRRYVASCYSWPGIYPKRCMELYGRQLRPIIIRLIEKGGIGNIDPHGRYFERTIGRAQLSNWINGPANAVAQRSVG